MKPYYFGGILFNTTIGEKWPDRQQDYVGEPNPFQRDNGHIKSPGAISRLIREDNSKARTMCKLAGESLNAWFPENPK